MSQLNVGIVNSSGGVQLPSFTTAALPTGVSAGFLAFDSTEGVVKVYNGTKWARLTDATVTASGGDEIYDVGTYRIHKFISSGSFTVTDTSSDAYMDFMIIGGGGGGGCSDGNCSNGGGGAGGLVYKSNIQVRKGSYPVVIGSGGQGYTNQDTKGDSGTDSSFYGYVALGGGGAGAGGATDSGNGRPGGSGGGGSHPYSGTRQPGLQPTSSSGGFGNYGGNCTPSGPEWGGGGGGGAGEDGQNGTAPRGGFGGDGLLFDIDGTSKWYAGGGAGGNCNNPNQSTQPGGLGGGGWAAANVPSANGGDGFGGGGGGAGYPSRVAGRGGNGVVIIRYPLNTLDPTKGTTSSNPATSAADILANNPSATDGLYWIKPANWQGSAQQIYCWMTGGGWMLVASNDARDTNFTGGTNRQNANYHLDRSGPAGTPDPNADYIIGSIINTLNFSSVRVLAWGKGSTDGTYNWTSALNNLGTWVQAEWTLAQSGAARLVETHIRDEVLVTSSGGGLSGNANFFTLDGIQKDLQQDGSYNANANQTTIGGIGTNTVGGDPSGGCYLGHGSNEGSFEGWYDASNSVSDCQGYTTWVK